MVIKITEEMLPLIRYFCGLNQSEFASSPGIQQSKLSDIETGKIRLSDHYKERMIFVIGKLKIDKNDLKNIEELAKA